MIKNNELLLEDFSDEIINTTKKSKKLKKKYLDFKKDFKNEILNENKQELIIEVKKDKCGTKYVKLNFENIDENISINLDISKELFLLIADELIK